MRAVVVPATAIMVGVMPWRVWRWDFSLGEWPDGKEMEHVGY